VADAFRSIADESRREAIRLRYALPPLYVLLVGPEGLRKNLSLGMRAWFTAALAKNLPHRLVVTNTRAKSGLRRLAGELGVTERVTFLGDVPAEDLPAVYSLATTVFVPSWGEGFGTVMAEAMASGAPVLGSHIGPHVELAGEPGRGPATGRIQHMELGGETGALLERPDDLPGWRAAAERILSDSELAKSLRAEGLRRVKELTWRRHAERLWEVFDEVRDRR